MINLDYNATTPCDPIVIDAMTRAMRDATGNPGSRHAAGRVARQHLERSRETIARILGAQPKEVIFTSGGTESTNLAMLGFAGPRTGTIALPPGEHPATEQTVQALIQRGWSRHEIAIDATGRLVADAVEQTPWSEVDIATVLLAHNETGVIQDIARLSALCGEHRIPLHVDAVQAVGKLEVDFRALGATSMSIGAHKFHGPRGIGVLLLHYDARLHPLMHGGFQEQGKRPGTEPVALAVGMATALEQWEREQQQRTEHLRELRDRLQQGLVARCEPVVINGLDAPRLPNTLNIAFPGLDGDALLVALDLEGICCSLGSACASGSSEPAPMLVAMGCRPEVYNASVRFTLGKDNTLAEVDEAIDRIATIIGYFRA